MDYLPHPDARLIVGRRARRASAVGDWPPGSSRTAQALRSCRRARCSAACATTCPRVLRLPRRLAGPQAGGPARPGPVRRRAGRAGDPVQARRPARLRRHRRPQQPARHDATAATPRAGSGDEVGEPIPSWPSCSPPRARPAIPSWSGCPDRPCWPTPTAIAAALGLHGGPDEHRADQPAAVLQLGLSVLQQPPRAGRHRRADRRRAGVPERSYWTRVDRTGHVDGRRALPVRDAAQARLRARASIPRLQHADPGGRAAAPRAGRRSSTAHGRALVRHVRRRPRRPPGSTVLPPSGCPRSPARSGCRPGRTVSISQRRRGALPGPNVMMGYAETAADLARGDDRAGCWRTGDLGALDDEGFLYLTAGSGASPRSSASGSTSTTSRPCSPTWPRAAALAVDDRVLVLLPRAATARCERVRAELATRLRAARVGLRGPRRGRLPLLPSGKVDYPALSEAAPVSAFTLPQQRRRPACCPSWPRVTGGTGGAAPRTAGSWPRSAAPRPYARMADVPWLPVRLFKTTSCAASRTSDGRSRCCTSSGTTGAPSRIHLDREAAAGADRALAATMRAVLGPRRLPMLIVDTPSVVENRRSYSARGAGVLGMMQLRPRPRLAARRRRRGWTWRRSSGFLPRHGGEPFLDLRVHVHGLATCELRATGPRPVAGRPDPLRRLEEAGRRGRRQRRVPRRLAEDAGLRRIHNFYGMVEQIGTVFLEGPTAARSTAPTSPTW